MGHDTMDGPTPRSRWIAQMIIICPSIENVRAVRQEWVGGGIEAGEGVGHKFEL